MSVGDEGYSTQSLSLEHCINSHCPWSGDPVSKNALTLYRGNVVGFYNPGCRDKFASALAAFDDAEHQRSVGYLPPEFTESSDKPPCR